MDTTHPWNNLPTISDTTVSMLINGINGIGESGKLPPRVVYIIIKTLDQYVTCEQLRKIHSECPEFETNYMKWYLYDHALCSRVKDPWNLTPRMRAEGYYYCSFEHAKNLSEPPRKWIPMQLDTSGLDSFFK